jgi:hypothetical protein
MADYTVEITNFPDHKRGDRWVGVSSIGPVKVNGSQPTVSLERVRMQFRRKDEVFRLDTDDSKRDAPIVIDDSVTWEASIPEVPIFLKRAGVWEWDMEFWEAGAEAPLTFYKGSIEVFDDITR